MYRGLWRCTFSSTLIAQGFRPANATSTTRAGAAKSRWLFPYLTKEEGEGLKDKAERKIRRQNTFCVLEGV
jgi:hypothetical protein